MAPCLSSVFSMLQRYMMKSGFVTHDAEILLAKHTYTGLSKFCGPIAIIVSRVHDTFNKESLFSNDSVSSR